MKKITLITLSVFMAGLLLAIQAPAASKRSISRKKVVEQVFDVKEGGKVELDIDTGGDIYVTGWDNDKIAVEVVIEGRNWENVEVDFDKTRSGLKIDVYFDKKLKRNRVNNKIHLKVPEKFDIHFSTMGGDVKIEQVEGKFTGKTMGGDMKFKNLKGFLKVTTMGGDIQVSDSELDGNVKTYGGDVRIDDVEGDIRGSTMGGDVHYSGVKKGSKKRSKSGSWDDDEDDEVNISTFGGDLDLDYEGKEIKARTFGGDINVARAEKVKVMTMGGDIDIDQAPKGAEVHTMGGDITINTVGEFVKAKTMGGDIEVKEIDGWVKATTMGGDVIIRMAGNPDHGKHDVDISSMGGDIELYVPDGLSMEFDIEISYTEKYRGKCRIVSDFPIEIEETKEWKRKWGQKRKYIYGTGDYKGGEHKIKIRTINGDIYIRKN